MSYSTAQIWTIIAVMGVGTYLIRFSFLGLLGDRKMPDWVLRHLRYTPVAFCPESSHLWLCGPMEDHQTQYGWPLLV